MTQRFTTETAKAVADKVIATFTTEMFAYRQDRENNDYAKPVYITYRPTDKAVFVEYGKTTYCGYVNNGETVRWSRD